MKVIICAVLKTLAVLAAMVGFVYLTNAFLAFVAEHAEWLLIGAVLLLATVGLGGIVYLTFMACYESCKPKPAPSEDSHG